VGWAAIVSYVPDSSEAPLAWLSGSFTKAELGWPSIHREVYALVATFRRYPELFSSSTQDIEVLTDSEHLVRWTALDIKSDRLAGWNETLNSYKFKLKHIPGTTNIVADALSRPIEERNKEWMGKVFPEFAVMQTAVRITTHATPPTDIWSDDLLARLQAEKQDKPRPHPYTSMITRKGKMEFKSPAEWAYYANNGLGIKQAFDDRKTPDALHAKFGPYRRYGPVATAFQHGLEDRAYGIPQKKRKREGIATIRSPCKGPCTCVDYRSCQL
jgi:hypothetical protein